MYVTLSFLSLSDNFLVYQTREKHTHYCESAPVGLKNKMLKRQLSFHGERDAHLSFSASSIVQQRAPWRCALRRDFTGPPEQALFPLLKNSCSMPKTHGAHASVCIITNGIGHCHYKALPLLRQHRLIMIHTLVPRRLLLCIKLPEPCMWNIQHFVNRSNDKMSSAAVVLSIIFLLCYTSVRLQGK